MPADPNTVEPSKPRRRWFQFRLRTLLIGVVILGVVLGAVRSYVAHEAAIVQDRKALLDNLDRVILLKRSFSKSGWLRRKFGDEQIDEIIFASSAPQKTIDRYKAAFPEAKIFRSDKDSAFEVHSEEPPATYFQDLLVDPHP